MKTKWIVSKTSSLYPLIMAAVMGLATMGCEESPPIYPERPQASGAEYSGNILSQTFTVYPEGTEVTVLGGTAWLKFPVGSVLVPTEFNIASFSIHHLDLDGINMFKRGIYLEGDTPYRNLTNVMIRLNYDLAPENWKKNTPAPDAEKNLTIYHVSPTIYAYQRINSIGDCCVDCSGKMIKGCISSCGFYVLGEN